MKEKRKQNRKKLSIVIPVYNEKNTIISVLEKVNKIKIDNIDIEIIVVDDCSTDGTREILKKNGSKYADKILYHEINQGKGGALKTGFSEITGDVAIVQDADFEYDPNEIPSVVLPIFENKADVVYGSRFLNGEYKGYKKNQYGNKILNRIFNIIYGVKLTDVETCYKAFKSDFIKNIDINEKRFGFEPEITSKVVRAKLKIIEVPISYKPRTIEEGKKIRLKDGLRAVYCVIKYRWW